jgi:hypothetical protein
LVDVDCADDADSRLHIDDLAVRDHALSSAVEGDRAVRAIFAELLAGVEVPQQREGVRSTQDEPERDADYAADVNIHPDARQRGYIPFDSWSTKKHTSEANASNAGAAPVDTE